MFYLDNSADFFFTDLKHIEDWSTAEVAMWLETLALGEYQQTFITNEIRGSELLSLERSDLKVSTIIVFLNVVRLPN